MTRSMHTQGGWTFQGLLLFFLVIGSLGSVAANLVPVYVDHKTLVEVIEGTLADRSKLELSPQELKLTLQKKLGINNLKLPDRDAVKILREDGYIRFYVDYEVRVPMYYNVDALVSFKDTYEAIAP